MSERGERRRLLVIGAFSMVIAVALAVLSLYGLASYRPSARTAQAAAQTSITPARHRPLAVFVGDSYVAGKGASTDKSRWSSLVAQNSDWQELNFGLVGTGYATSAAANACGQALCPSYQASVGDIAALHPDVVVVAGGQSDFATFEKNPARVRKAVKATIGGLRKALPQATMIVVGPSTTTRSEKTAISMEASVQRAAKDADATFVSLLEPRRVVVPTMVVADGVNVDDSGQAAIAKRVLKGLS